LLGLKRGFVIIRRGCERALVMRARSWAGVAKLSTEVRISCESVAYHSMHILMSITRERERGLVAELPDVFRIVFRELLVLAVPIEKKD